MQGVLNQWAAVNTSLYTWRPHPCGRHPLVENTLH